MPPLVVWSSVVVGAVVGCACSGTLLAILAALVAWIIRRDLHKRRLAQKESNPHLTVGIFHPYCDAGGGGERVLWVAVGCLREKYPGARLAVYTGDVHVHPEEILTKARKRFGISVGNEDVEFVYLTRRRWVEASRYPYATLLGQSLGSMWLALEAVFKLVPDVYIDTMGYSFTLPVFRHLVPGCKVGCYVHYPTVSTDMLTRLAQGGPKGGSGGPPSLWQRSPILKAGKMAYYRLFAQVYGACGRAAHIVMVNSSWTEDHILRLWGIPERTHKVYPPCNVDAFKCIPLSDDTEKDTTRIVSIAQFRPEKDHPMQIRSMYELRQMVSEEEWDRTKLVLIGGCRDKWDEVRVKDMQDLCKHMSVEDNVEFKVNLPFPQVMQEMEAATLGMHTMWNEHFGIGVVECMAAGLVMIAHRSGGPLADIVVESEGARNGFLASDEWEYARAIGIAMRMRPQERKALKEKARASVDRFSDKEFHDSFLRAVEPLFRQ